MKLDIKVTGLDAVKKQLNSLSGNQIAKVTSMAINKTADKARAEVNRAITERYAIKATDVRNSVTVAKSSAAQSKLQATISIFGSTKKRGRSLNLIHFMERKVTLAEGRRRAKNGTLNQLRFQIVRGNGLKTIPGDKDFKNGAFIGNKGRTVFQRTGNKRLPIKPVQVIGVGQMFNFRRIRDRVLKKIDTDFQVELNRAIRAKLAAAQ